MALSNRLCSMQSMISAKKQMKLDREKKQRQEEQEQKQKLQQQETGSQEEMSEAWWEAEEE